jgi:uncharacterized protein involved in exopolysaccharide biosynthesis
LDNYTRDVAADDAADLREVATKIWRRRWWILTSTFVSAALFVAIAFLMPRIYRAENVMISASLERQSVGSSVLGAPGALGGLASLTGINFGASTPETEEALAVLKSRAFTEAFIRDKHLMPELYPSQWDAQAGNWKAGTKVPTLAKAYRTFDQTIREIVRDKKTGLITLRIDWKDPVEGAAWANELVERLNSEMRARAIAKANASLSYLEKEQETAIVVPTREAIGRLIEAQVKQRMLATVTQEYAFRVVDKALPADRDLPVSPQKPLMLALGLMLGSIIGIARALLFD